MGTHDILTEIDREIEQLKRARALLTSSKNGKLRAAFGAGNRKKRNLTPEGRRRIAEAVRRRWARQKAQAASKVQAASGD